MDRIVSFEDLQKMMDEQQSAEIYINESVEIVVKKLPEGLKAIHCNGFLTITDLEELFVSLTAMGINLGNVKTFGNGVKLTAKNASIRAVSLETIGANVEIYAADNIYMPRLKNLFEAISFTAGGEIKLYDLEVLTATVQMVAGKSIELPVVHTIGVEVKLIAGGNIMMSELEEVKADSTLIAGNCIAMNHVKALRARVKLVAEYFHINNLKAITRTTSIFARYEPKSQFVNVPWNKLHEGDYSPDEWIYLNGQLAIVPLMRNIGLQSPNRNIFKDLISKKK